MEPAPKIVQSTTLVPHGEELAILFDQTMLDLLKMTAETPLRVTTDGKSLFVTPVRKAPDKAAQ